MPVDFSDTSIAFEGKTDSELRRARFLFSVMGKKWLVSLGKNFSGLAAGLFKGLVKSTIFKQFVGGETIEECEPVIIRLNHYHIGTILDYSVEGAQEETAFDAALAEILKTVEKANGDPRIPFCVFKVTGLAREHILEKVSAGKTLTDAESQEWEKVKNRVDRICRRSWETGTPVFVDGEDSWIQDAIDGLAEEMTEKYNREKPIVYNTLQMYRHDRVAYLQKLWEKYKDQPIFPAFKIVRGAYMEKERARATEKQYPDPIQPDKEATDSDFDEAVMFCLERIEKIAICAGTHNEKSSLKLAEAVKEKQLPPHHPHVYFAQLLGMSDHISHNLAKAGYNVAKYVPYGPVKEVLPYLIRRAEENTSVAGQTGRELGLILQELKRRKASVK